MTRDAADVLCAELNGRADLAPGESYEVVEDVPGSLLDPVPQFGGFYVRRRVAKAAGRGS